ncbi:MAG: hypothetical protein JHD35_04260 [Sphingopyxis sp.]|nr:hypothetical protein [Sphingopyxis sp.]
MFIARNARWRIFLVVAACVGLVVVGFIFSGLIVPIERSKLKLAGWLFIVTGGGIAIALFPRLVGNDVRVKISHSGIFVRAWSNDTIPWSEIARVWAWGSEGKPEILVLDLLHPSRFPSTTLAGRFYWKINSMMAGGDIWVSLLGTDGKIEDGLAAAEYFRSAKAPETRPTPPHAGFGRRRV